MKKKNNSQPAATRATFPDPRQPSAGALLVTLLVAAFAAAAAGALLLWGILPPPGTPPISAGKVPPVFSPARALSLGGGIVVLILAVILSWRASRPAKGRTAGPPTPASGDETQERAGEARETRLFVHLMARLQREGRLLDFLAEDLDAYDDAQIGAAARSVHAGCRRVVDKLLAPRPVMAEGEAASVTLDEHYDAAAVTLTGRVGDKPPFQGIVRHAGWRAARIDIPVLAEETDPAIIAPAEVEVVG